MSILSLLALTMIGFSIKLTLDIINKEGEGGMSIQRLNQIVQIGLFALVFGIFGQVIGLFQAFIAIEEAGDVSFAMLAGGLKVSMITTIYGFVIFLLSYIIWFSLKTVAAKKEY